jgi:tRNA A37 threonylcarbamoyltransferase TsaD
MLVLGIESSCDETGAALAEKTPAMEDEHRSANPRWVAGLRPDSA